MLRRVVIPPLVGGLHCGFVAASCADAGSSVIPPLVGGLHCGKQYPEIRFHRFGSSRRWSAGSIAA